MGKTRVVSPQEQTRRRKERFFVACGFISLVIATLVTLLLFVQGNALNQWYTVRGLLLGYTIAAGSLFAAWSHRPRVEG